MKYTFVEIGGEKRPVAFSKLAIARYLNEAGQTVGDMDKALGKSTQEYTGEDLINIYRLLFHAMKEGLRIARKQGEKLPEKMDDFHLEDIADWTEEDETKLAEIFDVYAKSQAPATDKKKTTRKAKANP